MYTREDEDQARRLWKKRLGLALVPMIVGLAAGIALFVVGQMRRSDTLWMAKPALDYLRHVERMLHGRKRETVGVLTRFSPELCERDGLWCHAMMVNLGSGEEEDDRLFYYDDEKPAPQLPIGTRVRVESNDKMVSGIWQA